MSFSDCGEHKPASVLSRDGSCCDLDGDPELVNS